MGAAPFVSLHTHSHYSLQEGVDAPEAPLERAAELGYDALALTDSNALHGAVAFAEAARRFPVRPILSACLRAGQSRCTALIAEPAGYRSMTRRLSRRFTSR
jgi:DNA polymerase III alpha subunit